MIALISFYLLHSCTACCIKYTQKVLPHKEHYSFCASPLFISLDVDAYTVNKCITRRTNNKTRCRNTDAQNQMLTYGRKNQMPKYGRTKLDAEIWTLKTRCRNMNAQNEMPKYGRIKRDAMKWTHKTRCCNMNVQNKKLTFSIYSFIS